MSLVVPAIACTGATPFLSLVVPTYNESSNVQQLVQSISEVLDPVLPHNYQIILVDDDSPDQTWAVAAALMPDYPQLVVIRRQTERGLSTAVIRGWQQAEGEVLGVIDGDLQHPPQVLLDLVRAIQAGASIAIASRYTTGGGVGNWNGVRQFLSQGAVRLAVWILPEVASHLSDPMSGFFLVRREAIADLELSPIGYKILLEVMARGRIKQIKEVGYTFAVRNLGSSKVTWRQYEQFIRHLLRLRFATGSGAVAGLGRFLRFALVGLTGVLVDFVVLWLLGQWLGFDLTSAKSQIFNQAIFWSKALAIELAIVNNFIWNDLWTFADAKAKTTGNWSRLVRFGKFNLACSLGAALNLFLFSVLTKLGLIPLWANLLAITCSTAWNYLINLKFNWKRDR